MPKHKSVVLPSNRHELKVRVLGLYELDTVTAGFDLPDRDYHYTVTTMAGEETEVYKLDEQLASPPEKPEGYSRHAEPPPDSMAWGRWHHYTLHQAALRQREHHDRAMIEQLDKVGAYILACCVSEDDRGYVETEDDFAAVYQAVLTPRLTMADVKQAAAVLKATYAGENVVEAVLNGPKSSASGDVLRMWELQLVNETGLDVETWVDLDVMERAVRIVSKHWDSWVASLSWEEAKKEHG